MVAPVDPEVFLKRQARARLRQILLALNNRHIDLAAKKKLMPAFEAFLPQAPRLLEGKELWLLYTPDVHWARLWFNFVNFADRAPVVRIEEYPHLDPLSFHELYTKLKEEIAGGRLSYQDLGSSPELFQAVGRGVFVVYISSLMFVCKEARNFYKETGRRDLGMLRSAIAYCFQGKREIDMIISDSPFISWLWPAYEWFDNYEYKYSTELAGKVLAEIRRAKKISPELIVELDSLRKGLRREWSDLKVSWWERLRWWFRSRFWC